MSITYSSEDRGQSRLGSQKASCPWDSFLLRQGSSSVPFGGGSTNGLGRLVARFRDVDLLSCVALLRCGSRKIP